jgi:hypothetical protein
LNRRVFQLAQGPAIALVVVGLFATLVGYGSYRVVRHLFGWGATTQTESLRIDIDEATLRRVDVADSKVELSSDLLGMFGATLVVTPKTEIRVDGTPARLSDLTEGMPVRAAYEWRDGFKVAASISAEAPPARAPVTR